MKCNFNAIITAQVAAELVLRDEIDLFDGWQAGQAKIVLDEILSMSSKTLLSIVDGTCCLKEIAQNNIPQFGYIDNIIRVPETMFSEKSLNVDYVELGFMLKKDPSSSMLSNQKFGENHGKVAAQIGIINCVGTRFVPSVLSETFVKEYCDNQKKIIGAKLFTRIPIIRILIKDAKQGTINGYDYMKCLEFSTRERRGSSVRAILKEIKCLGDDNINQRIDNITWEYR